MLAPAMVAIEALREAGVSVLMNAGFASMKSQFRRADASGAAFALIFGETEVARGEVALKALRNASAPQALRPLHRVAEWAGELSSPEPGQA